MKKILYSALIAPFLLHADIRMPRTPQQDEDVVIPSFRREKKLEKKIKAKPSKVKRKGLHGISYHKTFSEMKFDELKAALDERIKKEQWTVVIEWLPKLLNLCDDVDERAEIIVALADIQFNQGFYDDASKWYKEFIHLYPGNKNAEYAHYRSIVCTSRKILSSDRDQTKTEETIDLANKFLERDIFTNHRDEVIQILHTCYETIAESELNIGEFYITMGDYQAAERRLGSVRTDWLDKAPQVEMRLASLEINLSSYYESFKPHESSLLLVNAAQELKQPKKSMAGRF